MMTESEQTIMIALVGVAFILIACWMRAIYWFYARRQNRYKNFDVEASAIDEEYWSITGNLVKEFNDVPITKNYQIQSVLLGRGASAHVVVGVHNKTQRRYAVKIIDTSAKNIAWRYEREIDILRLTDHTNIVRVYEMYRNPTSLYFVMELCTGGHLGQVLKRAGDVLDQEVCIGYVNQITRAIFHCHAQGIVHRDIKLQNILLESNGKEAQVKLVDFGNSARFSQNTLPLRKIVGTTYTAAPEVFRQEYDERCDIWSLGVVTYILLSGKRPFESLDLPNEKRSKESSIIANILIGRYHFLHDSWDNVSDEAVHFVRTCLEVNYKNRASAHECLQHPWLNPESENLDMTLMPTKSTLKWSKSLERNVSSSGIRRTTMLGVAFYLPNTKIHQLRLIYQKMDTTGRGYIGLEEFRTAMNSINPNISSTNIDLIFAAIDTTGAGYVSFTEFVAATLDPREVDISELNRAFRLLDKDSKGYIDRNDLQRVLAIEENKPENSLSRQNSLEDGKEVFEVSRVKRLKELNKNILSMIEQVDMDKDGVISYTEFLFAMADGGKETIKLTSKSEVLSTLPGGANVNIGENSDKSLLPNVKLKKSRRLSDSAVKISNNYSTRRSSIVNKNASKKPSRSSFANILGFGSQSGGDTSSTTGVPKPTQQSNIAEFVQRNTEMSRVEDKDDISDAEDEYKKAGKAREVPTIPSLMWKDVKINAQRLARRMSFLPMNEVSLHNLQQDNQNMVHDSDSSESDEDYSDSEILTGTRRLSSPALLWQSLSRRASNFGLPVPRRSSNFGLKKVKERPSSGSSHGEQITEEEPDIEKGQAPQMISSPKTSHRGDGSPSSTNKQNVADKSDNGMSENNSKNILKDVMRAIEDAEVRSLSAKDLKDNEHARLPSQQIRKIASSKVNHSAKNTYDHMAFLKSEAMECDDDETLNIEALPAQLRMDLGIASISNPTQNGSKKYPGHKEAHLSLSTVEDGSGSTSIDHSSSMSRNNELQNLVEIIRQQQGENNNCEITPESAADLAENIQLFQEQSGTFSPYGDLSDTSKGNNSTSMPTIYEGSTIKNDNTTPNTFLNSMFNAFLTGLTLGQQRVSNQPDEGPEEINNSARLSLVSKPGATKTARRMSIG